MTQEAILAHIDNRPDNVSPRDHAQFIYGLAEDVHLIQSGSPLVAWPVPDERLMDPIRDFTFTICLLRLASVSRLGAVQTELAGAVQILGVSQEEWDAILAETTSFLDEEQLSAMTNLNMDWKEVFLIVPTQRLLSSRIWTRPFDAVEGILSESNFPVPNDLLDEMHSQITRAHGWFGVGEWGAATARYVKALALALATNNYFAVESIARFLVDTYTAAGDSESAVRLAEDYLRSPGVPRSYMTREMLEAVAVALAFAKQFDHSRDWLRRASGITDTVPNADIENWNIIELLRDVHSFRKDKGALSAVKSVASSLRGKRRQWRVG
ncbi:MAG: hypothetical protein PHY79_19035 [Anaerolineae bacterium]|jgi:hypothetical protein|nr:hypothetical protein [Anaerolineae bacterium]MDX9832054.1 hypothetical protein [Anaerolineae bacterium]